MATKTITGRITDYGYQLSPRSYFSLSNPPTVVDSGNGSGEINSIILSFSGSLDVFTTPVTLEVYINGEYVGQTQSSYSSSISTFNLASYTNDFLTASTISSIALYVSTGTFYLSSSSYTITINYSESVVQPTLTRPGNPVISYTPGDTTFTVSWAPAYGYNGTGIVTYNLFMQGSGYVVQGEPVTSYTGPVPEAGTYNFRVTANYPGAESQQSEAIAYTFEESIIATPTLTAPTNLKLSATSGEEVKLTWTEAQLNNSEINYIITYKIGYLIAGQDAVQWPSGLSTYNNNFLINKQWFLDNNIPNDTEIRFWLEASVATYNLFKYVSFPEFKVIFSEEENQNTIGYYYNNAWQECTVYYYNGSQWVECIPYYYDNGWQEINTKIE